MLRYAQASGCRREPLLAYFGETAPEKCDLCDNCQSVSIGAEVETVDVTNSARLFVECVKQTGETFGPAHITDILRGSRNKNVLRWKHDRLQMHGQGQHLAAQQWRELAQQLIGQGILKQDDRHGGLALGPKGKAVLAGAEVRAPATLAPTLLTPEAPADFERGLFEELRKLRANLAKATDVPAFVIFSDRTLQEMARALPQTPQGLRSVPGIGERKLAQYGEQFLDVIRSYCRAHGLSERAAVAPRATATPIAQSSRRTEVGTFFAAGVSVEELQRLYGVKADTILQHLIDYHQEGHDVDVERLLSYVRASEAKRGQVFAWFEELGATYLRPCSTRWRARCRSTICGCCGYTTCRVNHLGGRQNRDSRSPSRRAMGPGRHGAATSRGVHWDAWRSFADQQGRPMTYDFFSDAFGFRNEIILRRHFGPGLADDQMAQFDVEKERLYRALLLQAGLQPLPGVREWIDWAKENGWRQALASMARAKTSTSA